MRKAPYYFVTDVELAHSNLEKGRIIDLGAVVLDGKTLEEVASFQKFSYPEPGAAWNIGAEKIHGLSLSFLNRNGVGQRDLAISLLHFLKPFKQEDNSPLFMVYHASYALEFRFIKALYEREGLISSFNKVFNLHAQENTLNLAKSRGLPLNLKGMCEELGVVLENHHSALADARATAECFKRMICEKG